MKIFTLIGVLFLVPMALLAQLPETYDLRDVDGQSYVTSVKSQSGGTCWTHGTMASIEGNLYITGAWSEAGETGEPALAEYHLDWWNGFNQHNNDDLDPPSGTGLEVHMGGDYRVSTAYLSRGEGAVREIDGQSYDNPPVRDQESYHYYYPRTVQWYTLGDGIENIDIIKQAIIDYGVMATCMCYSNAFINSNYTHYQPMSDNTDPNHSVAIIGWDDDKQTQADLPGAWLCKNSWGSWWGENGYFWISYYDKHACRNPEMGAVSFQEVEPMQYEKVFYHDYHGWRDQVQDVTLAANRFDIEGDYFLNGVNFFVNADNAYYTATIFETMGTNGPENQIASVSGTTDHIGFYTADFDTPVSLVGMSEFVIQLELSDGGMPYDRTSDIPVLLGGSQRTIVESVAHENESFYYNPESASWEDFYNYDDPSGFSHTGNFCIKGLATATTVGLNSYQYKNINVYPNPADNYANIVINNNRTEKASIVVRNITGSIVYTQSIALTEGENNVKINTNNIKAGVYSLEITDDENVLGKEKIIIR